MSDTGRKALLVVNPLCRHARDAPLYIKALEEGGLILLRRETTRIKMNDLILSMKNEVDCVVLAGGDGTLGAGAIALRDTGLPLGIIPLGHQNELASRLGIPRDPAAAAAIILEGNTARLNLGSVNGRPFFNVASVGLTVESARSLNRAARRGLAGMAYLWRALRLTTSFPRFSAIIRCGSIVHRVRTIQITIGNGRTYAGAMLLGAATPLDEQTLGVYSLEPVGRWRLLFLHDAFTATPGATHDEARLTRSPVVEVVTRLPRPITADGEVVTVTPARFSILSRAVDIYVPASPLPSTQGPGEGGSQ